MIACVEPGSRRIVQLGLDARRDLGHGLLLGELRFHGVDARGVTGEIHQEHAPGERIVEGAAQRDAHRSIDHRSPQDLDATLFEHVRRNVEGFELPSQS